MRMLHKAKQNEYTEDEVKVLKQLYKELASSYNQFIDFRKKMQENGDHSFNFIGLREYYDNFAKIRNIPESKLQEELAKERNLMHASCVYLCERQPALLESVSDGKAIAPDLYDNLAVLTLTRLGRNIPISKKEYSHNLKNATNEQIHEYSKNIASTRDCLEFTVDALEDYMTNAFHELAMGNNVCSKDFIEYLELQEYLVSKNLKSISKIQDKHIEKVLKAKLKNLNADEDEMSV